MVTLPKVNYEFKTILKIEGHSSQNQENQPTYTHIEGEINKNKNYKNKQKTEPILNKKSKATGITTLVFIHKNRVTVTKATQYQYKNRHLCQWARQPRNKFTHSQCAVFFSFHRLDTSLGHMGRKKPSVNKMPPIRQAYRCACGHFS